MIIILIYMYHKIYMYRQNYMFVYTRHSFYVCIRGYNMYMADHNQLIVTLTTVVKIYLLLKSNLVKIYSHVHIFANDRF